MATQHKTINAINLLIDEFEKPKIFPLFKEGLYVKRMYGIIVPDSIKYKIVNYIKNNYITNNHDIFIVTYPKCGTTWLQAKFGLLIYYLQTNSNIE